MKKLVRSASVGFLLSAIAASVGCGDDEVDGQGGGAGATTSDASSSASGSTSSSTTASSGTPASATASSGTSVGTGGGGSGEGGAGGSGEGGAGGSGEGGAGGEGSGGGACAEQPEPYDVGDDTKDACAELEVDPDAPPFHVEFIGEPTETFEYDGTIALDMAFNYVLALPLADLADFTLVESRCQLLAGDEEPNCSEGEIDLSELDAACSERLSGRFGIDPSGVREGINSFDFTMTLRTGCAEVSDSFTLLVDYQPEG